MYYFTILHKGQVVGGEFGRDESDALNRYAAGSIYPRNELTAVRGKRG